MPAQPSGPDPESARSSHFPSRFGDFMLIGLPSDFGLWCAPKMDPQTLITELRALISDAELQGADAPQLRDDGIAMSAAKRARAALNQNSLTAIDRAELQIVYANALRLSDVSHDAAAQEAYRAALAAFPEEGAWWFDFGLLHKWRGRFAEGLQCFEKARESLGTPRGVLWNIAICATALGKGAIAAQIWNDFNLKTSVSPKSQMPFVEGMPPLLLRVISRRSPLSTSALPEKTVGFEVLWVAPASPCHGVVQSPAFGDCPVDYGDMVLWDGAPIALYQVDGQDVPVFPLLEILRRGDEQRFSFLAHERKTGSWTSWIQSLDPAIHIFVSQETLHHECPSCDAQKVATTPHSHALMGKIICSKSHLHALHQQVLNAAHEGIEIAIPTLFEALQDTKHAGQHHQLWGRLSAPQ